jgi:AraC-like DNA-binding protein
VAGRGWVEDEQGVNHPVQPGEAMVIPARTPHGYGADESDPWSIYWFHFTGRRSLSFLELLEANRQVRLLRVGLNDSLVELFQELLRLRQEGYSQTDLRIHSTIGARLLLTLVKLKQEGGEHLAQELTPVERAARFMKDNLRRSLTLEELAAAAGLSITHFNRLFKAATGFTPITYFTHLKIMHASRLLDATEHKIAAIAAELGFEDPYTFSRVFKRVTGKSPANYRDQRRV